MPLILIIAYQNYTLLYGQNWFFYFMYWHLCLNHLFFYYTYSCHVIDQHLANIKLLVLYSCISFCIVSNAARVSTVAHPLPLVFFFLPLPPHFFYKRIYAIPLLHHLHVSILLAFFSFLFSHGLQKFYHLTTIHCTVSVITKQIIRNSITIFPNLSFRHWRCRFWHQLTPIVTWGRVAMSSKHFQIFNWYIWEIGKNSENINSKLYRKLVEIFRIFFRHQLLPCRVFRFCFCVLQQISCFLAAILFYHCFQKTLTIYD